MFEAILEMKEDYKNYASTVLSKEKIDLLICAVDKEIRNIELKINSLNLKLTYTEQCLSLAQDKICELEEYHIDKLEEWVNKARSSNFNDRVA